MLNNETSLTSVYYDPGVYITARRRFTTTMTNDPGYTEVVVMGFYYNGPPLQAQIRELVKKIPKWEAKRAASLRGVALTREDYDAKILAIPTGKNEWVRSPRRAKVFPIGQSQVGKRRSARAVRNWRRQT